MKPKSRELQEQEANLFARSLLMPEHMVRSFCAEKRIRDMADDRQIRRVAEAFKVPIAIAAIRLSEINL